MLALWDISHIARRKVGEGCLKKQLNKVPLEGTSISFIGNAYPKQRTEAAV